MLNSEPWFMAPKYSRIIPTTPWAGLISLKVHSCYTAIELRCRTAHSFDVTAMLCRKKNAQATALIG